MIPFEKYNKNYIIGEVLCIEKFVYWRNSWIGLGMMEMAESNRLMETARHIIITVRKNNAMAMMVKERNIKMLVRDNNFNIRQIAESGQCFRMNRMEDQKYNLIAYGKYLELTQLSKDTVELSCNREEFTNIWEEYFDLKYDYSSIVQGIAHGEDDFLKEAIEFGKGIRILKQEPFEAMISFIISQNKNIPAIKNCIAALCVRYGKKITDPKTGIEYHSFPTPEILGIAKNEDLRCLKTGYRDEYIIRAAQAVSTGAIDLSRLKKCSFKEAVKELKNIHGIGEKVANCVCLYGLHHIEGFPIDVWIARVLKEIYHNEFDQKKYEGYAGIVQQYMFYYMRSKK